MEVPRVFVDEIDEGVWLLSSEEPGDGETVDLLGTVHGDEPAGADIIYETLLKAKAGEFKLDRGNVIMMLGNLAVINEEWENNDGAGMSRKWHVDMNRMFIRDDDPNAHLMQGTKSLSPQETYEYARTRLLMSYMDSFNGKPVKAAYDAHMLYEENVPNFLITEENGLAVARRIGAPVTVLGLMETEKGGSDYHMNNKGTDAVGICHELGYSRAKDDPRPRAAAVELGHEAFRRLLITEGLLDEDPENPSPPLVNPEDMLIIKTDPNHMYKYREEGDYIVNGLETFRPVRAGTVLGRSGGQDIVAEEGHVAFFPNYEASENEPELLTLAWRVDAA